jgi:glycosyltransferase involved in cell wall biosynthesis
MLPLVSVIIPVYNSGIYLRECIDSVIGQSYQNIETIVVDDRSTDGCAEFLRSHVYRGENVHLFDQVNKGACAARNLGISKAKGDIQFLDADDLLSYKKIEKQINLLDVTKSNMIATCEWVKFSQSMENCSSIPYGIF